LETGWEHYFLGRTDNQIKIRGYRIELSEIEKVILQYKGIESAVCWFHEQENAIYLFVTAKDKIHSQNIRTFLAERIPAYAIPHHINQIDQFVYNINGKLDVIKILSQLTVQTNTDAIFEENNRLFADIFKNELHLDHINGDDNFFALGGDSLKAIFITSKLLKLGYQINIEDLFNKPSMQDIFQSIRAIHTHNDEVVIGVIPLTPPQKRFFNQHLTDSHFYNQGVLLYKHDSFDVVLLKQVLKILIDTHDILRCVFEKDGKGDFVPIIHEKGNVTPNLTEIYVDNCDLLQQIILLKNQEVQKTFSLSSLLFAFILYKTAKGDHLYIAIHHLLVDFVSWNILLEDLSYSYKKLEKTHELPILSKSSSYKAWGEHLITLATSSNIINTLDYWTYIAEEGKNCYQLQPSRVLNSNSVDQQTVVFDKETTSSILHLATARSIDMHALLLAAVGIALKRICDCEKFFFELDFNGRNVLDNSIQLSRTVGWFNNLFPFILSTTKEDCLVSAEQIKKEMEKIPNNGISYSILKYISDKSTPPIQTCQPKMFFNYLGEVYSRNNEYVFEMSAYDSGPSKSSFSKIEYNVDIIGRIEQNCLSVIWNFDTNMFSKSFINSTIAHFKSIITSLPQNKKSDKEFVHVTDQEYQDIIAMVNDI